MCNRMTCYHVQGKYQRQVSNLNAYLMFTEPFCRYAEMNARSMHQNKHLHFQRKPRVVLQQSRLSVYIE